VAIAEQEIALNALPRFAHIKARSLPCPNQIPHGFVHRIGNPDGYQIASPQ